MFVLLFDITTSPLEVFYLKAKYHFHITYINNIYLWYSKKMVACGSEEEKSTGQQVNESTGRSLVCSLLSVV